MLGSRRHAVCELSQAGTILSSKSCLNHYGRLIACSAAVPQGAGTSAHVLLELFGDQGMTTTQRSGVHCLEQGPYQPAPFGPGQTDAFEVRLLPSRAHHHRTNAPPTHPSESPCPHLVPPLVPLQPPRPPTPARTCLDPTIALSHCYSATNSPS